MTPATITPQDLLQKQQQGARLEFIDVRTPAEYEQLHAPGARLVPLDTLDPAALARDADPALAGGAGSVPIYLICKSGTRAAQARQRFHDAGVSTACCVEGGMSAWERAGLPVVRGAGGVISLERQVRIAAGALVLVGILLGWLVHPLAYALAGFVGAGLIFAGMTDWCGMGLLLARMPWNHRGGNRGQLR